jgi:predicted CopG family antitoxin
LNKGAKMSKTITLRLKDEIYNIFLEMAKAENRSISNLVETAALNKIREQQFIDDVEMAEILSNQDLLRRIKEGSNDARSLKGRFVE